MPSQRERYLELVDPDGETYEDGSRDLSISAEHPSLYPTRTDRVDVHMNACDVAMSVEQLRWLVEHGPTLIGWIEERAGDAV